MLKFCPLEIWGRIGMGQSGAKPLLTRLSGQTIIDELIRNMELGRLEMSYSILLPCIFSVYLHPDDYNRLASVQEFVREDARRALNARMAEWNSAKKTILRRGAPIKQCRIAQSDWWIELFIDSEGAVPAGDVEIHSELNDSVQPGYRGVKTTLINREPSVTEARVERDRESTRRQPERVFAEIRYQDDSGPQTFFITQNEVSVGRGGQDLWVDLPLYTGDQVSREHFKLLRNPKNGTFNIFDQSRNGTWINGKRVPRGVEHPVPDRAEIGVAEVLKLSLEVRR
jgi:hypothetical protein